MRAFNQRARYCLHREVHYQQQHCAFRSHSPTYVQCLTHAAIEMHQPLFFSEVPQIWELKIDLSQKLVWRKN